MYAFQLSSNRVPILEAGEVVSPPLGLFFGGHLFFRCALAGQPFACELLVIRPQSESSFEIAAEPELISVTSNGSACTSTCVALRAAGCRGTLLKPSKPAFYFLFLLDTGHFQVFV